MRRKTSPKPAPPTADGRAPRYGALRDWAGARPQAMLSTDRSPSAQINVPLQRTCAFDLPQERARGRRSTHLHVGCAAIVQAQPCRHPPEHRPFRIGAKQSASALNLGPGHARPTTPTLHVVRGAGLRDAYQRKSSTQVEYVCATAATCKKRPRPRFLCCVACMRDGRC